MSKSLFVRKVSSSSLYLDYTVLSHTFSNVETHNISCCPWQNDFPYIPEVTFQIVHSSDIIGLHYTVQEDFLRAQAIRPNENVWEDSCVEFFISLDQKQTYFNFEFNILGTGLIGYGSAVKSERNRLAADEIELVNSITQVVKTSTSKKWEIFILIPKVLLTQEDISGRVLHGNFYKCGDALPQPHFITWNNIENPKPNFHLPKYFGELNFE